MTSKKVSKKRSNVRMSKANKSILIGLLIVSLPFIILVVILLSAASNTGKPLLGQRFLNDLDPAITKSNISDVEKVIKAEKDVDKVTIELVTATMRVYVNIKDTATEEEAKAMASTVYKNLDSILSIDKYFTSQDGKKMYDLEIHVFNLSKKMDGDNFVYVIQNKNAMMKEPHLQLVSKPLNEELAQQLRDDVEARKNPTPKPESSEEVVGTDEEEKVAETAKPKQ